MKKENKADILNQSDKEEYKLGPRIKYSIS